MEIYFLAMGILLSQPEKKLRKSPGVPTTDRRRNLFNVLQTLTGQLLP
jgi:hypothetical protein